MGRSVRAPLPSPPGGQETSLMGMKLPGRRTGRETGVCCRSARPSQHLPWQPPERDASCSVGRGDLAFKHRKDYVSGEATVAACARMEAIHGACLPWGRRCYKCDGPRGLPADTITDSASDIRRSGAPTALRSATAEKDIALRVRPALLRSAPAGLRVCG